MQYLETKVDARGVATLTLSRPEKHNALSAEMIAELTEVAKLLGSDDAVRVIVVEAEGPTFCAGGDLGWMRAQMAASPEERRAGALALARMLKAMNEIPKPLIGAVHGNAFGGGVGLISVCDVAFGVEGTQFGLTETRLGLIPATIGPYVVARMGSAKARRVFYSSRRFDAQEAVELGLIAQVVSQHELAGTVAAEVKSYLACAPGAVAAAKAHLLSIAGTVTEEEIIASADALVAQWEGGEAMEGLSAFFEKRAPRWAV